jgi:hypothetical protein
VFFIAVNKKVQHSKVQFFEPEVSANLNIFDGSDYCKKCQLDERDFKPIEERKLHGSE